VAVSDTGGWTSSLLLVFPFVFEPFELPFTLTFVLLLVRYVNIHSNVPVRVNVRVRIGFIGDFG